MSLATFTLASESREETPEWPVAISEFESQNFEQRRLLTNRPKRVFRIRSPALTQEGLQDYIDFYNARNGALERFNFTTRTDLQTYTVRFEPGSFEIREERGHFRCVFRLRVTNEDETP